MKKQIKEIKVAVRAETTETRRLITPAFGEYVTKNTQFISHLNDARKRIESYLKKTANPKPPRPLNILLAAPPGSGKSFLIKQMIKSIKSDSDLTFEEIYIASFDSVMELYSIFQRVQSINLEGKVPVVFFDEVDSKINESEIYKKFLAPMWDGTFFIGKDKFYLGKCIFFFAGSTISAEEKSEEILNSAPDDFNYDDYFTKWRQEFEIFTKNSENKDKKIHDFMDRVDLLIRIPPISKKLLGEDYECEYLDRACMLVAKHFPSVRLIGKIALDHICKEMKENESMRPAEKIIFGSRLKDDERFDLFCMPDVVKKNIEFNPASVRDGIEIDVIEMTRDGVEL